MTLLGFVFASAIFALPVERHIDCSGWQGVGRVEVEMRITTAGGRVTTHTVELFAGSDAAAARSLFWVCFDNSDWRAEKVGENIIVLRGSKSGPLWAVEFKSLAGDWVPDVKPVLVTPKKE